MSKNKQKSDRQPSELGQFVSRDLPTDNQVNRFDKYLKGGMDKTTVSESLAEIYEGEGGQRVNVKRMDIRSKRSIWATLGIVLLYILGAAVIAGGVYYWIISRGADSTAMELTLTAPQDLVANQEFEYTIEYKNQESVSLTDVQLTVVYPSSFVFESSFPSPNEYNNKWNLDDLRQFGSGRVTIKGRLIAPVGASNILFADVTYRPSNISSEFKKSSSLDTIVAASGLDIVATAPTSILVNQEAVLNIKFKAQEKNFLDHFTVRFPASEIISFPTANYGPAVTMSEPGVFDIAKVDSAEQELKFKFKFTDKKNDSEELKIAFEYQNEDSDAALVFDEKLFTMEIVKNSLNLTIIANGQPSDQGSNFGQTINYTISYINKGETPMNDVIIMAVLDGEALDWRKLIDKNNGNVSGRTITWTKNEIPELQSLSKGQEGAIDFSIPIRPVNEASLIRSYEIKSYAQFAISGKAEDLNPDNDVNRSNLLTIKINSDISLDEAVRYFDSDNIAVGTGPLPPQAGQTTTFKVYWVVTNSLHEMGNLKVTTKLPDYISWDNKDRADVGTLSYNPSTNEVTWDIGRLPLSASTARAEFSISLKPKSTDRNKLLVLVSGTTLSGLDNQTTFPILETLKAQTTRLEKDDIADTNGIVI